MNTSHVSGIVFTGFGGNEIFPSLAEVTIDGGYFDRLRLAPGRMVDIGRGSTTIAVEAFAQSDVAESFIYGFDVSYRSEALQMLEGFLKAQIEDVIENHTKYDDDVKK